MRSKIKNIFCGIAAAVLLITVTACNQKQEEVYVLAATSLEDALTKVIAKYSENNNSKITASYAASGQLAMQIENSAPADIFLSAGEKQTSSLAEKGFALETKPFLKNELVMAYKDKSFKSINDVLSADIIAMGESETVPAGQYAKQALENAGIWSEAEKKAVFLGNVREVLTAVDSGNADVGFVYYTDLKASPRLSYEKVSPELYKKIVYPAQLLKQSDSNKEAKAFYEYLFSEEAKQIFEEYNFITAVREG